MILTFIEGHSCVRKSQLLCLFSRKLVNQCEFSVVCCQDLLLLWSLLLSSFCLIGIHGKEPYLGNFTKNTYISLCLDVDELVSFKLGMVLDKSKCYCWCQSEWPWPFSRSQGDEKAWCSVIFLTPGLPRPNGTGSPLALESQKFDSRFSFLSIFSFACIPPSVALSFLPAVLAQSPAFFFHITPFNQYHFLKSECDYLCDGWTDTSTQKSEWD